MKSRTPILLSFYGLSNGTRNVFFGKLAYSRTSDLSFKKYNWLQNFKTIVRLYQTRGIAFREFEMTFDHGKVKGKTDASGSFWCEADLHEKQTHLVSITLLPSGERVQLTEDLYPNTIQSIDSHTIVISDLDDTLIHSFIRNKFNQLRTLLFTTVENRKEVTDVAHLIKRFALSGAHAFYLSNSEQNLYPMLYRFLNINSFPPGPLFLKQYIRFSQLVRRRITGKKPPHKMNTLAKIMELFPSKQFILLGDNTQLDLKIYLQLATLHPERIRYIIIRKVYEKQHDIAIIDEAKRKLEGHNIGIYYENEYPKDLPFEL